MQQNTKKPITFTLQILMLASFVVAVLFYWQGNNGFNLWDEGFLWYGVQRVMLGEVPVRDFMSYEPGRYYWSASLMTLWGNNGIMSLRYSVAIFQGLGLFAGLLSIASGLKRRDIPYLILCALTLIIWMYPRHKIFDASLSIFLVGILTFLVKKPTAWRYFLAGTIVGVVATFGRNHGLYGAVASAGVLVWLSLRSKEGPQLFKASLLWCAGVIVGFSPLIFMALLVPGFAASFWDTVRFLFEVKATNLSLPVPWPWKANFSVDGSENATRNFLIGTYFLALIVFVVTGIYWIFRQRLRGNPVPPAVVAACFLGLPYAQYAFSRADAGHLALGIFPLLIGCLVLCGVQRPSIRWTFASLLCAASVWTMSALQPGWQCHISRQCVDVQVSHDHLEVDQNTANDIKLLRQLKGEYAPHGEQFVAAPFWPGAYALLGSKSPMWEIYALFPRPPAFEQAEIRRIQAANPAFVVILDSPLDGRDELRFRNTHPLTYQYILQNYSRIPSSTNPDVLVLKPRDRSQ